MKMRLVCCWFFVVFIFDNRQWLSSSPCEYVGRCNVRNISYALACPGSLIAITKNKIIVLHIMLTLVPTCFRRGKKRVSMILTRP